MSAPAQAGCSEAARPPFCRSIPACYWPISPLSHCIPPCGIGDRGQWAGFRPQGITRSNAGPWMGQLIAVQSGPDSVELGEMRSDRVSRWSRSKAAHGSLCWGSWGYHAMRPVFLGILGVFFRMLSRPVHCISRLPLPFPVPFAWDRVGI